MTVGELIDKLNEFPSESIVTDEFSREVSDVEYELDEKDPNKVLVWFVVNSWTTYE